MMKQGEECSLCHRKPKKPKKPVFFEDKIECSLCHRKPEKPEFFRGTREDKLGKVLNHHYPIPECLGGRERKPMCYSCHQKDHARYSNKLIQRLIDEIEGRCEPNKDMFGEDPHAERRKLIQEALKRAEEEKKQQPKIPGVEDEPKTP